MSYRQEEVLRMNPLLMAESMLSKAKGYSLPGWEEERLAAMAQDVEYYQNVTIDQYWTNIKYFLDAVLPYAEKYDLKMAIHPDDPPWPLFGLPKVITNAENIRTLLALNDSPANGLCFCTGSLGANLDNDLSAMAKEFSTQGRIPFAHVRNVKHLAAQDFDESAHPSAYGDLDLFMIMKALHESGFDGYIRPDHGRMIWGEKARPGYGLYDRAIGATYLYGLWEALTKIQC
jgi:mannonate dehydratase